MVTHLSPPETSFGKHSFSAVDWIKHQLTSNVKLIWCSNRANPVWASEFGLAEDALILQCDESGFGGMSAGWIEFETRYRAKREPENTPPPEDKRELLRRIFPHQSPGSGGVCARTKKMKQRWGIVSKWMHSDSEGLTTCQTHAAYWQLKFERKPQLCITLNTTTPCSFNTFWKDAGLFNFLLQTCYILLVHVRNRRIWQHDINSRCGQSESSVLTTCSVLLMEWKWPDNRLLHLL